MSRRKTNCWQCVLNRNHKPQTPQLVSLYRRLILAPTRELAVQITEEQHRCSEVVARVCRFGFQGLILRVFCMGALGVRFIQTEASHVMSDEGVTKNTSRKLTVVLYRFAS